MYRPGTLQSNKNYKHKHSVMAILFCLHSVTQRASRRYDAHAPQVTPHDENTDVSNSALGDM